MVSAELVGNVLAGLRKSKRMSQIEQAPAGELAPVQIMGK